MREHDDQLNRLLKHCPAPEPPRSLDARVLASYRATTGMQRHSRSRTWLFIAAGVVLMAGFLTFQRREPPSKTPPPTDAVATEEVRLTSTMQATGFRPVAEGAITVIKGDQQQ